MNKLKSNKGNGLIAILVAIVGTVASTGLFTATNTAGSGLFVASTALVAYSQMPHVTKDFQYKKAIDLCESFGGIHCETEISNWSEDLVLFYITDDERYMGNGGNFVEGYMN